MNCLPDVEYMVWKFLYTSCLKACICFYLCVMSATFTSFWQPSDLGEASHTHTHTPKAIFFQEHLSSPLQSRHSLTPWDETQINHKLLEANTGPVQEDSSAWGSTHCTMQALRCQLASLMATRASTLVNKKIPRGRWPWLKITKINTMDWVNAGFKPSFHLNFHFYYLYKSFHVFIADIFMELSYSREM